MIVKNRTLLRSVRYGIAIGALVFSIQARADGGALPMQLATGQLITPTAPRGAVQQFLNPGLAAYPDFVAGEAVRSQLSPDGTTLAVICAGQNSLVQAGRHASTPPTRPSSSSSTTSSGAQHEAARADAGDQADERPRRPGLLAGRQHAVRRRRQATTPSTSTPRAAGVAGPLSRDDSRSATPTRASASASARTPAAWHLRRRHDAGRRQQLQRLDQRHRHGDAARFATSTTCARSSPATKAQTAASAAPSRSRWS